MLRDGAAVAVVLSSAGTGYIEYDAVVVKTIRNARRGFVSAKYVENARLSDLAGAAAALCDSVEEASGGNGASARLGAIADTFKRLRRRWGSSSMDGSLLYITIVSDSCPPVPLLLPCIGLPRNSPPFLTTSISLS